MKLELFVLGHALICCCNTRLQVGGHVSIRCVIGQQPTRLASGPVQVTKYPTTSTPRFPPPATRRARTRRRSVGSARALNFLLHLFRRRAAEGGQAGSERGPRGRGQDLRGPGGAARGRDSRPWQGEVFCRRARRMAAKQKRGKGRMKSRSATERAGRGGRESRWDPTCQAACPGTSAMVKHED